MKLLAYAKLNLVLRVVGRREDGYHLIQSLFCAIDLADEIWLYPKARGIELLGPEELGPPEKNLAFRAAKALLGENGPGVRIVLHKNIPVGAGLGGGSSNAAAVLAGLNWLYSLGKTEEEMKRIGAGLGADVPFFLGKSPAWVEGVGEIITPVDIGLPAAFLLVVPPFPCPTPEVYRLFDELRLPFSPRQGIPTIPPFSNDLWPAATALRPELRKIREVLESIESLGVGLSGSGSTLFLAFSSRKDAEKAKERLMGKVKATLYIAQPVDCGYKIVE